MASTLVEYGTCTGEICQEEGDLCKHFPTKCSSCVLDGLGVGVDPAKMKIYYAQCFYCLLAGDMSLEIEWDNYGEAILQGHDAFRIGYQDRLDGREIPDMDCDIEALETLYKSGYQMGAALCKKHDTAFLGY